jgi:two-component system chemotaxis sensor kinase CheA
LAIVDPIILKAFLNESSESIQQLELDLHSLESDLNNKELLNSVFRALHTIKGNSSFLDLHSLTQVAHEAESILDRIRNDDDQLSQETIDVLFSVVEALRSMIEDPEGKQDMSAVLGQLLGYSKSNRPIVKAAGASLNAKDACNFNSASLLPTIRIEEAKIERMVNMVNELKIIRFSMEAYPNMLKNIDSPAARELRLQLELAITKMSRISGDLGAIVYSARLVPVDNVFRKFPRIIRDLSKKLGKEIELEILNGSAELDKSIVEAIADPLTHLIRNAADHGIETSDERLRRGKPAVGKVILNSFVDVNSVVIEIRDDGKGIDVDVIARKAVEKNIISKAKVSEMSYADKLGLIFAPGFSTAESVTDISGRGVGMDVVKSNINKLKGTVSIHSDLGKGTKILLRFPLSVVSLHCLYAYVEKICYAIPLQQVEESLSLNRGDLYLQEQPVAEGFCIFPLFALSDLLWDRFQVPSEVEQLNVLKFVAPDGKTYGLLVDSFSFMEEAVIHSVDSYISSISGIQGGVIRKDGTVTVSLNLDGLFERIKNRKPLAWAKHALMSSEVTSEITDLPKTLYDLIHSSGFKAS